MLQNKKETYSYFSISSCRNFKYSGCCLHQWNCRLDRDFLYFFCSLLSGSISPSSIDTALVDGIGSFSLPFLQLLNFSSFSMFTIGFHGFFACYALQMLSYLCRNCCKIWFSTGWIECFFSCHWSIVEFKWLFLSSEYTSIKKGAGDIKVVIFEINFAQCF